MIQELRQSSFKLREEELDYHSELLAEHYQLKEK